MEGVGFRKGGLTCGSFDLNIRATPAKIGPVAQLYRAAASGAAGRRLESYRGHQFNPATRKVAGTFLGLSVPDGVPASKRTERTQRAVPEPRRAATAGGPWLALWPTLPISSRLARLGGGVK